LLRDKSKTKKKKKFRIRDIGFAKRYNFNQEMIKVLPRDKNLTKKRYKFNQGDIKV